MCRKAFEDSILDISNCSVAASTPIPHKRQKKKEKKEDTTQIIFLFAQGLQIIILSVHMWNVQNFGNNSY